MESLNQRTNLIITEFDAEDVIATSGINHEESSGETTEMKIEHEILNLL